MAKHINKKASKWLKALESGNYKQARETLFEKRDNKTYAYCCLGLACNLDGHQKINEDKNSGFNINSKLIENDEIPFLFLKSEYGIKSEASTALVYMNDEGMSFSKIAKEIRKNPSKYFNKIK